MREHWRAMFVGAAGAIAVGLLGSSLIAVLGLYDVAADVPHTTFVRDAVEYVRDRSIEERARTVQVPPLDIQSMIVDGASDYDTMCTGCHLAPGVEENEIRPGMNPKPPRLAEGDFGMPTQAFWIIKHGIKMTGMPAWGVTHSDQEIWNLVAFLQKLPKLTPAAYRALVAQSGGHHDHNHLNMSH